MGVMMLAAGKGSTVVVETEGDDEQAGQAHPHLPRRVGRRPRLVQVRPRRERPEAVRAGRAGRDPAQVRVHLGGGHLYGEVPGLGGELIRVERNDKPAGGDIGNTAQTLDPDDAENLTTSGAEGIGVAGCAFVDCTAADEMERVYRGFAEDAEDYEDSVYDGKRSIMAEQVCR